MNLLFALIIGFLSPAKAAEQGSDKIIVLPMFGYSDEQGLGMGANAAWLGIQQTSWNASAVLLASTPYSQTYFTGRITNQKSGDIIFVDFDTRLNKSGRNFFYGIGNETTSNDVAQLKIDDSSLALRLGANFMEHYYLGLGLARRTVGIDRGVDPSERQFLDVYSYLPRLSGVTVTTSSLFFMYDSTDSLFAPQSGILGQIILEKSQPQHSEDLSMESFTTSVQYYHAAVEKELIIAMRGLYRVVWGSDVPFFLQSSLGGQNTLRAYRTNRFNDAGTLLFNFEARWTFWNTGAEIFSRFELHGALEFGRVFSAYGAPLLSGYHPSWVAGLTGIMYNQIPLRLDYAAGPEGRLIYLHLFYPF